MVFALTTGYSGVESILKLIGLIILCVIIIAASYFVTKMIGRREAGYSGNSNFKAIDAYRLTPNKYLQLIKIGERYFVIAVCKENVSLICEIDREDIRIVSKEPGKFSFKDVMAKAMHKKESGTDPGNAADAADRNDPGAETVPEAQDGVSEADSTKETSDTLLSPDSGKTEED